MGKGFRRIVDNRMKSSGDIDFDRKVIRVNQSRSRGEVGGVLDTQVHEELHRKHPRMHESTVTKKTTKALKTMGPRDRQRIGRLYRGKG
jgi:hypothetical protein